ncbi:MAG: hypothetical protein ABI837_10805, partial [Acidobacteriota bacterium]
MSTSTIARPVFRIASALLGLCFPTLVHGAPLPVSTPGAGRVSSATYQSDGSPAAKFITFWDLSENQPDIEQGGRANTIAVNPADHDRIFVASESGGLFKSVDRGLHWTHVDSLPAYFTQSVAYLPSSPDILLVSTKADFKSNNGGGIWRSADGGSTWNQASLNIPGFSGRLSAFEISIMPGDETIFVATSEGVFVSVDRGLTWTYSDVFPSGDNKVLSVLATRGGIYAGGPSGVRIGSGTTSLTWVSPVTIVGDVGDIHAFGRSALSSSQAFVFNGARQLWRTEDGGAHWIPMISAPSGRLDCGGISFIKTIQRNILGIRFHDVYLSDRCDLYRLTALVNAQGTSANYFGAWQHAESDHGDTRDLALIDNQPFLLATDGGLHQTADGGSHWHLVGGGRNGGYNALQVTEVKGQYVASASATDLYFGTQDNNLWATNIFGHPYASHPSEGFFIEAERRVESAADSQIAYRACGPCQNWLSGRHFENAALWNNAPGAGAASTSIMRRSTFAQGVVATESLAAGLVRAMEQWQEAG